jgi:stage II sporulation protein D
MSRSDRNLPRVSSFNSRFRKGFFDKMGVEGCRLERNWKQLLGAFLMGVLLPSMVIRPPSTAEGVVPSVTAPSVVQPLATEPDTRGRRIPVLLDGTQVRLMELETYIVGVVLGEMPADFEQEALKAQAVVARTYALRCSDLATKHPGGALCTDATCCQAYFSQADYLANGGTWESVNRIREAVMATRGQVVTYEGQLIEATYFACSGGRTEDALAVWGTDVPYLQSVDSPGEEGASCFLQTLTFTPENFQNLLGLRLSGSPSQWVESVVYTEGGGVASVVIGDRVFTGVRLRELLDLNSTAFFLTVDDREVRVTVLGNGHRVGMSQYGAEAMALQGESYIRILSHYYPGTRIDKIDALG